MNASSWRIKLVGAPGTLYEGEEYILRFRFGDDYPMEAPEVKIVKLIIDKQVVFMEKSPVNEHVYSNGHICLSILYDQWSPALTVSAICLSIQSMLSSSKVKVFHPPLSLHMIYNLPFSHSHRIMSITFETVEVHQKRHYGHIMVSFNPLRPSPKTTNYR